MRRALFGGMIAGALGLTVTVAAQNPPSQQPPPRTPTTQDQPRTQAQGATVTVEGCVMREEDVPGRKPNVAERAGVGEDFILTNSKMIRGSLPAGKPATQNVMFEIEGMSSEQIAESVGAPLGTVYSRLYRARKHFARALKRVGPGQMENKS